jgi:hypothetical protein
MSPAKFPDRKPDGSFCVDVGVQIIGNLDEDLAPRVQAWINDVWMPQHTTWSREWQTGSNLTTTRVQLLHYSDEFSAPPEIAAGPASELKFRLRGKKTAKFWKDWLVTRLMPDLREAFPAAGELLYIRDCAE